jgi:glyoxylase-like metal-dependent hydrolase (beta-lactamase superfamily II)
MIVETQAVGPFFKNGFVLGCEDTREAVLIDPGDEVEQLLMFAERRSLHIRHILLTHAHVDHVTGVAAAKRALGAPIYLHRDDLFLYYKAVTQGVMFGLRVEAPPPVDVFYSPGQVIAFGAYDARPHPTPPGHRPGGYLPAGWSKRGRLARRCSSATRSSPARSAGRTCRAATDADRFDPPVALCVR